MLSRFAPVQTVRLYSVVKPKKVTPSQSTPDHIVRPDYAATGGRVLSRVRKLRSSSKIEIKTQQQVSGVRDACKLARTLLDLISKNIESGITTEELDRLAYEACVKSDAYPSPLRYNGFPKSICTSVNNVACHGIPDDRVLEDGDIINVDVTVFYKGYHGDVSETYLVGNVDDKARHLVSVAKLCRDSAIEICRPGQKYCTIGKTISALAEENNCHVIREFCGHGIGSFFHGPPDILHYDNDLGGTMKAGTTFTIEPVICDGNPAIEVLKDGWTAVTKDNCLAAQFEHTILITDNGHEILTL